MNPVYELNLPAFSDIVCDINSTLFTNKETSLYVSGEKPELQKILKKEYQKFLGINWEYFLYFKKSNYIGVIHTDISSPKDYDNLCYWAINWVFGGDGVIEHWRFEDVVRVGKTYGAQNHENFGSVPRFKAKSLPFSRCITKENKVYLVNASLPHRGSGLFNRSVFSLRPNLDYFTKEWKDVVNIFANYIKTN